MIQNLLKKFGMRVMAIVLALCVQMVGFNAYAQESSAANAQRITVSGVVVDTTGLPVIGAAVVEKNNELNGSSTDIDGKYSLTVPANGAVVVSFLGYETQTLAVNNRTAINVTLKQGAEDIDAVVVVGYGTQSKKLVSSSIASIKMDNITRGAEVDPMKSLHQPFSASGTRL